MNIGLQKLLVFFLLFGFSFAINAQQKAFVLPSEATNLGTAVNSGQTELAPVLSADGQTLYFVRRGHPKNFGNENKDDIWMVQRLQNGQWSQAINCGAPINNSVGNRVFSIDATGQTLYLSDKYRSNPSGGLAFAQRQGRFWSRPRAIEIPDWAPRTNRTSFTLNVNGNVMVQSLDRAGGKGKNDLYVSFLDAQGKWTSPRPLGNSINTEEMEENPVIAYDNKTLYFSSRGHGGKGGADLFVSFRMDDSWSNWSKPVNLESINTIADDRFLSLSAIGDEAIVCYPDSTGQWDLYAINIPQAERPTPVALLNGKIINARTSEPVQADLGYRPLDEPESLERLKANADGSFTLVVPYDDDLSLHAEVDGYFSMSERMELANQNLKEVDRAPTNTLAALSLSDAYLQRDVEINQLSQRLTALDEELQELHHQYEAFRKKMTEDLSDKPVNYQELTDPALDALRHRYGNYLRSEAQPDTLPVIPEAPELTQKGGSAIPDDMVEDYDELADMKRRFRNHYEATKNTTEAPEEEYLWDAPKGIEDFQEEVRTNLRKELRAEVMNELIEESSRELMAQYQYDEVSQQQLQKEEAQLKAEIASSLFVPQKADSGEDITEPWQQELRTELREAMAPEVKKELTEELREDIRIALRSRANYMAKATEAEALQQEIDRKVLQQIREEEQSGNVNLPADENPSDLTAKSPVQSYVELSKVIQLVPVEVGQTIPLHNIFFNPNTATFKPTSYAELNRVVEFLRNNSGTTVEISSHTNGLLSHSQATQLSNKRAKVVADYLIAYGVPKTQISYKGYGKTQPIASNDTLQGRKQNQRIEMRILSVANQ